MTNVWNVYSRPCCHVSKTSGAPVMGSLYTRPTRYPPSVWPHLFCGAGHEKRRGEQLKWSLVCTLYIGSFPCAQLPGPVHTAPLGRVSFCVCIFSLDLCFAYLFFLFNLFVSPFFCVSLSSWVISLSVFGASVTNLNKPSRALTNSTIMWVRS